MSIIYRVTRWPLYSNDYMIFTLTLSEQISITEFLNSKGMPQICNLHYNTLILHFNGFFI